MKVKCPRCKNEVEYEGNPYRPFCSDRCKLIDLGDWASERFQIPVREDKPSTSEIEPASPMGSESGEGADE